MARISGVLAAVASFAPAATKRPAYEWLAGEAPCGSCGPWDFIARHERRCRELLARPPFNLYGIWVQPLQGKKWTHHT
jgi:hypothetical protein